MWLQEGVLGIERLSSASHSGTNLRVALGTLLAHLRLSVLICIKGLE